MSRSQTLSISHDEQLTQFSELVELAELDLFDLLDQFGLSPNDLQYFAELSPYLILDGHRSGMTEMDNPMDGYIEGAKFSLRFSLILQKLGGERATFLMHTLRNYQTTERMSSIFGAVKNIAKEFVMGAAMSDIRLRYYGKDVHSSYSLADLVNAAEQATKNNSGFELNYLTNYSEDWATQNLDAIKDLPDINVIGRFTKGHYSGAGIPCHSNKANFIYIQQASISRNWSDKDMICLALSLLKSHLALNGFIGGKEYSMEEKAEIYREREQEMSKSEYNIKFGQDRRSKKLISFSPSGPIMISY